MSVLTHTTIHSIDQTATHSLPFLFEHTRSKQIKLTNKRYNLNLEHYCSNCYRLVCGPRNLQVRCKCHLKPLYIEYNLGITTAAAIKQQLILRRSSFHCVNITYNTA